MLVNFTCVDAIRRRFILKLRLGVASPCGHAAGAVAGAAAIAAAAAVPLSFFPSATACYVYSSQHQHGASFHQNHFIGLVTLTGYHLGKL